MRLDTLPQVGPLVAVAELITRCASLLAHRTNQAVGLSEVNLGHLMMARERYVDAARWFDAAVCANPNSARQRARALSLRAMAMHRAGLIGPDEQPAPPAGSLPQRSLTLRLRRLSEQDPTRRGGVRAALVQRDAELAAIEAAFDQARFDALLDRLPDALAEVGDPGSVAQPIAAGEAAGAPLVVGPAPVTMPLDLLDVTAARKLRAVRAARARIIARMDEPPHPSATVRAYLAADWWYADWRGCDAPEPAASPGLTVTPEDLACRAPELGGTAMSDDALCALAAVVDPAVITQFGGRA